MSDPVGPIRKVAVIGAGTMGHGIAYITAAAGFNVALHDASPDVLNEAMKRIAVAATRGVQRGKLDSDAAAALLQRVSPAASMTDAASGSDIVIEAIPEVAELKAGLLRNLEPLVSPRTLLASNTSALSISGLAAPLERPERFIGMHFFNPVPAMKLIELVRGVHTSDGVVEVARALSLSLGKTPIVVRDSPGFATSRLGVVLGLEAIRMLEQGVATAADIDTAMELGYNHPMGPLRLTDLVGLDVRLAIAEHLYSVFREDTYRPPALLKRMVAEGKLGAKSGVGFYQWDSD